MSEVAIFWIIVAFQVGLVLGYVLGYRGAKIEKPEQSPIWHGLITEMSVDGDIIYPDAIQPTTPKIVWRHTEEFDRLDN